jgi:hypothetical protein
MLVLMMTPILRRKMAHPTTPADLEILELAHTILKHIHDRRLLSLSVTVPAWWLQKICRHHSLKRIIGITPL